MQHYATNYASTTHELVSPRGAGTSSGASTPQNFDASPGHRLKLQSRPPFGHKEPRVATESAALALPKHV